MARQILVQWNDAESTFDFSKIDRAKLYGKRKRMVLDPDGEPCVSAELSEDGTTIIRSGMTISAYFDEGGEWVEHGKLVGLNEEGEEVPQVPSTLGVVQVLAEATPEELSQNQTLAVYALTDAEVDAELAKSLTSGAIYKFPFNYRTGYSADVAFLLANSSGTYVIVTREAQPEWCELKQAAVQNFDDSNDLDDDLDFEMF